MSEPLDERYFVWLYSQIGSTKTRNKTMTHWGLARQLFTKEFVWLVRNDDNRVEEGQYLRHEFLDEMGIDEADPNWLGLGCSIFELLITLSRRLSFEVDGNLRDWFWHLIEMLDIEQYNDRNYDEEAVDQIDYILDRFIRREYAPNGQGGLFPLKHPQEDQRRVELWYQLNAYLMELF